MSTAPEDAPISGGLLATLREARWSLLTWWLLGLFGAIALTVVVVLTDDDADRDLHLLLIHLGIGGGMLLGNLVAFLRLRAWPMTLIAAAFGGVAYLMATAELPEEILVPALLAAVVFFPATQVLRSHREILATWAPLLYSTGAILVWADDHEYDVAWHEGQKWAIWDGVSLGILGGALFLFLLYLVARQIMVMRLWQLGPRSTRHEATSPSAGLPWATWLVGVLLLAVLTASTAVAAPYLFRSGPGDRDGDGHTGPADGPPEPAEPDPVEGEGGSGFGQQLVEQLKRVASQGIDWLELVLGLLVCLLLIRFLLYPPIRRLATLRHLERPAWPVPATRRIQDLWRRALIALTDAGLTLSPSEPACALAARARSELGARFGAPPPGALEAASIYERVEYQLAAVQKDDLTRMAAAVDLVVEYVDGHLDRAAQVKNLYRGTDPFPSSDLDVPARLRRWTTGLGQL